MSRSPARETVAHKAMAAEFQITVAGEVPRYARQAAQAAFEVLDRIEQELSRYIDNSEISRINRMEAGESLVVTPSVIACLRVALAMQDATGGAFDIAYASEIRDFSGPRLRLRPERLAVEMLVDGTRLDVGGIGKGFALDEMAALLCEWEVGAALLRASSSTVLATGAPPGEAGWEAGFGPGEQRREFKLCRRALSGSGIAVKGGHIVDPRRGTPARGTRFRAWAAAPSAAEADALSTAFMFMDASDIRALCRRQPRFEAWVQQAAGSPIRRLGGG